MLIHCAALVSIASANPGLWRVNVDGTRNITDLCEKYKIRKLIYVSSVYAIPEKRQGEVIRETDRFSASLVKGISGRTSDTGCRWRRSARSLSDIPLKLRNGHPLAALHGRLMGADSGSRDIGSPLFVDPGLPFLHNA